MDDEPSLFYEFGSFRLNVQERLLEKDDELVSLTPKVFETLLVLVEHSGHVLAKDDLITRLWPDTFVEESSLTQNISLLRRALDEAPGARQYIETIPKRGYRFVADVRRLSIDTHQTTTQQSISTQLMIAAQIEEEVSDAPAPVAIAQRSSQWLTRYRIMGAAVVALILVVGLAAAYLSYRSRAAANRVAPASIAILPFKTIGTTEQTEVLGLGMADALIIRLSHLNQTTVLPTSSISRYTNREKDAVEIGQALGVEAVLDGTVQREGDQVRVTAQLIRLSDKKSIWSAKLDKNYRDLFALQDTISEQLALSLIPKLAGHENDYTSARGPANQEAYEAYLTGLFFWNQRSKESLQKSAEYFENATRKDPNYSLAYALLGDVYFLSYADGYDLVPPNDALVKANAAINKALQLDENIAEAHVTKAGLMRMDPEGSDREYRRALELNPNQGIGHMRYAQFLFNQRKLEEAVTHARRAVELDPTSPVAHISYGFMLAMSRDAEGAAAQYIKALELQPDQVIARFNIANVYAQKHMFKEALAEFDRIAEKDRILGTLGRAYVYANSKKRDAMRQELSKLDKESPMRVGPLNVVALYGMVGDKETAFDLLDKIDPVPFVLARLKFDPDLDPLRGEQRFGDYLSRHHIDKL
jgi:DNA-binding winged helix-turn-helix (wHTH) protein/TolB-like protein/Tfp pilus assembly protein PilF